MGARRYYVDTSVFGGCFDEPWVEASARFLDFARTGRIVLLTSLIVAEELEDAPPRVRELLAGLPGGSFEPVPVTDDAQRLREAYLAAKVVGSRSQNDAMHVALATVARADAIVSWNFRDLVRDDHIKGFNRVNLAAGFGLIMIISPQSVSLDED